MQCKTLLASALVLIIAGAATLVMAQEAPPAPPAKATQAQAPRSAMPGPMDGPGFGRPGFGGPGMPGMESPVIGDLTALEHLYRESGRTKELPALYNEVLSRSQDPRVRTYVYHQLARVQSAPSNTDQAIATLRKSLDENLSNEAKKRAEFDEMRSNWEQRRNQAKPAPQS
ncbi:hypothetical protein [Dyella japonica]|uniref:Protein refolding chaperone Spy/CpxP family n=1 Tax=Dyella japonica TaxID=231455 RepID=A0ABV2JXL5_9GAMM